MDYIIIIDNGKDLTTLKFANMNVRDKYWQDVCMAENYINIYKAVFRGGRNPLITLEECPKSKKGKCLCKKIMNKQVGDIINIQDKE